MFNHWLLSWVKGEALVSENNWNLWGKTKEWVFFYIYRNHFITMKNLLEDVLNALVWNLKGAISLGIHV